VYSTFTRVHARIPNGHPREDLRGEKRANSSLTREQLISVVCSYKIKKETKILNFALPENFLYTSHSDCYSLNKQSVQFVNGRINNISLSQRIRFR